METRSLIKEISLLWNHLFK